LQIPTIFCTDRTINSVSFQMYMPLMTSGRQKYIQLSD